MKSEFGRLVPRTNGGGSVAYLIQRGEQTSVVGSMFSGKSDKAINEAKRAVYSRRNVQVFKPSIDDRYDAVKVNSHDKDSFSAQLVDKDNPEEILYRLNGMTSVVVID